MNDVTLQAARAVKSVQCDGYRGIAIVHDPALGQLVLFRADEMGCTCLGTAPVPVGIEPAQVTELPGLTIPLDITPTDAFRLVDEALHRRVAHRCN